MCMPGGYHHERAGRCQGGYGSRVGTRVGIQGGYNGWVMGGLYRVPTDLCKAEHLTAKRAPERPAGAWSGWSGA